MLNLKLNRDEIKSVYDKIKTDSSAPQKRGYILEKLISSTLSNELLEPRTSYRPLGEQIDGSFFWQGQTYLIEAKWHQDPIPVSSIYAFKGKLDGKFHTTSGVFVSMSGFSTETEDALRLGKALNIILFNGEDMDLILLGQVSFLDVLKFKLRQAGDTGSLYAPYKLEENAEDIADEKPFELFDKDADKKNRRKWAKDILVFVEGRSDQFLVNALLKPLRNRYSLSYRVIPLNGIEGIKKLPALLNVFGNKNKLKGIIILLDDDNKILDGVVVNVVEQIYKAANSVQVLHEYISETLKVLLKSKMVDEKRLEEEDVFIGIESFIQDIAYGEHDLEEQLVTGAIEGAISAIEWDYKNGLINFESSEHPHYDKEISNIEELVQFIEESIYEALNGEMPTTWLKEKGDWDYSWQIREYLSEHHEDKIRKLGWNVNDL
jgi:hypothetical protein